MFRNNEAKIVLTDHQCMIQGSKKDLMCLATNLLFEMKKENIVTEEDLDTMFKLAKSSEEELKKEATERMQELKEKAEKVLGEDDEHFKKLEEILQWMEERM